MSDEPNNENPEPEIPAVPEKGRIVSKYDEENELLEVMFLPAKSAMINVMVDPTGDFTLLRIPHSIAEPMIKSMVYTGREAGMDVEPNKIKVAHNVPPTEQGDAGP